MIEIKSSLVNAPEFKHVKDSLIKVSEIDNKEQFRVKMLEYIDATADNNDDMFFYDMMEFIRFLDPASDSIAFTTPDKRIFLNSPGKPGENRRVWDFIYCHECLHQLWETFAVAEKIKKEGIEYNHKILNIASDCVINDYLSAIRKKEMFKDGISPEYLKEKYGIDFDRKVDTQYTLYLKLLEIKDKVKNDPLADDDGDGDMGGSGGDSSDSGDSGNGSNSGNSDGSGNSSSGNGSDSGNSSGSGNGSGNDANLTADDAKKAADDAKDAANKAQAEADAKRAAGAPKEECDKAQAAADKAKEAAEEAKEAAKRAKECADAGDKEGEAKAAKEAKDAANKAKNAAQEAKDGKKSSSNNGKGQGNGEGSEGEDLGEIKAKAEEVIEKYKNKLSGKLDDFLKKCRSAAKCEKEGLAVKTSKGVSWNKEMNTYINSFVKKKVFQKKRRFESTFYRVKRGTGEVQMGEPLKKGKRIKNDTMIINAAFYIDRSGSMSSSIKNVFSAVFTIAESLKRHFKREKVVDGCEFKTYAFDMSMREIPFGKTISADGGTMDFDEILKFIDKNSKDFLINIIITDAGFSVNKDKVKNFLKTIPGLVIFITNIDSPDVKAISKETEFKTKLNYILADSNFTIK